MNYQIEPNIIQKFVVVESDSGIWLYGDPNAKWHKDIVKNIENSGVSVVRVKGGAKIKIEKNIIYVWGESNVYGEISFEEVKHMLQEKFPEYQIINKEPKID